MSRVCVAPLFFWVGVLNIGAAAARPAAPVPTALTWPLCVPNNARVIFAYHVYYIDIFTVGMIFLYCILTSSLNL